MNRAVILVGALVALLASTLTLLFLLSVDPVNPWRYLMWLVALAACGTSMVATAIVAVVALRRPSGGSRRRNGDSGRIASVPRDSSTDVAARYRAAVEMAWADGELNAAEKEQLRALESELGLSWEQAAEAEREIMGAIKENIPLPENKNALWYRGAVEVAWADGRVNPAEVDKLRASAAELGLSGEQAAEVERQVMGAPKEDIVTPDPPPPADGSLENPERYKVAVKMAWADKKLNERERDYLGSMVYELDLDEELAGSIEREIMGATRDEIVSPGPNGDELLENEPWVGLVEDCVEVVEELDRHMTGFDSERKELADHVMLRMEEVLERAGVEVISDDETLDKRRHNAEKSSAGHAPGDPIAETLSPGFAVGRRVLRRARVRVE